jgi:hypothetical protein
VYAAFGLQGYLLVCLYFVLGSAVTKLKLKQKQAEGIAEARGGLRAPPSVWGSGIAGIACALGALCTDPSLILLWRIGFVASLASKVRPPGTRQSVSISIARGTRGGLNSTPQLGRAVERHHRQRGGQGVRQNHVPLHHLSVRGPAPPFEEDVRACVSTCRVKRAVCWVCAGACREALRAR